MSEHELVDHDHPRYDELSRGYMLACSCGTWCGGNPMSASRGATAYDDWQKHADEAPYPKRTPVNAGIVRDMELVEVGTLVSYFTKGMSPIQVKGSDIRLYPHEARLVAAMLLSPDARKIGEQLRRAADMLDGEQG